MRVLIVDDNRYFLDAARGFLEREGMTVVGVASTSADALRLVEALQPDVTLVDVDLGPESGLDLARQLVAATSGTGPPVILISANEEEDLVDLIEASPAIGFVTKSDLSGRAITDLVSRGR